MDDPAKKHAYLIIAHKNIEQLRCLIRCLDDIRNDIYLLIDKKSYINIREEVIPSDYKSGIFFCNQIEIEWGGYSQIQAEMQLMKSASENGPYQFYHLLSGQDLPLHSQNYIHKFFEVYSEYEFFTFVGERIYKRECPENRVRFFYPITNSRLKGKIRKYFLSGERRVLVPLQKSLHINRCKKWNLDIGYGSNWVSISEKFVDFLLSKENEIKKIYHSSFCCDEVYKHTYMLNSEFREKLFVKEGIEDKPSDRQGNMRYINWWDGTPKIFTYKDKEEIIEAKNRGYLFCRKFDEAIDKEIISFVCDLVKKDNDTELISRL